MSNVGQWFGVKTNSETRTGKMLISLTELYKDAISRYFETCSESAEEFVEKVKKIELKPGDKLFFDWFEQKGINDFRNILSVVFNYNDDQLEACFDYSKFILQAEMDFNYPEDVRSILFDIGKEISGWIEKVQKFQEPETTKLVSEWIIDDYSNNFWDLQEKTFLLTKLEESVNKTDSLIFFTRECCNGFGRV